MNTLIADIVAIQETRSLVAMLLTQLFQINHVLASLKLKSPKLFWQNHLVIFTFDKGVYVSKHVQ